MTNSVQKGKIDFQRIAPIIALSFAVGFGVATGAYFFIFCDDCFTPLSIGSVSLPPDMKCDGDLRCILDPPSLPPPTFTLIGLSKIDKITEIVNDTIIQQALIESNEEFNKMSPSVREDIIAQREKEWTTAPEPTPFMLSIINNDIADFLRENLVIPSDEFGDIVFGEHILTNIYGPMANTS